MARYLITGAAGAIGSALTRHLLEKNHYVCAFDHHEDGLFRLKQENASLESVNKLRLFIGDVRDLSRLRKACDGVDYLIHTAALKHVELSEFNVLEAIETNIDGTKNVVNACISSGVKKAIFTSSDKAVNPTSTMGATKLMGEKIFISSNNMVGKRELRFATVRFGNVLNSSGSVVKIFNEAIDNNKPLPITDLEMTRFYITIKESVDLCLYALDNMKGGEIFVRTMGSSNIKELAKAVANGADFDYKIIGAKPGEKLYEELVTEVEAKRTVLNDKHYIILPEKTIIQNELIADEIKAKYGDINPIIDALNSKEANLNWEQVRVILNQTR